MEKYWQDAILKLFGRFKNIKKMEYNLTEKYYNEFVRTNDLKDGRSYRHKNYMLFINHLLSCFPSQKTGLYVENEFQNGTAPSQVAGELLEIALARGYLPYINDIKG